MEQWKSIEQLGTHYQVSDLGHVRRLARRYATTYRGHPVTRALPEKTFALRKKSRRGYSRVNIGGRVWQVHRLVALAWVPNPDGKPHVNHKDARKDNNASANLEWVTNRENHEHAARLGLYRIGPRPHARKYTKTEITKMLAMLKMEMSLRAIGRAFGTSHATIRKIMERHAAESSPGKRATRGG